MSNEKERYNQIIDEAYCNYKILTHKENERNHPMKYVSGVNHLTETSFIQMCKIDSDFSKKWGLKIEERELNAIERMEYYSKQYMKEDESMSIDELLKVDYEGLNIPTKLITITYQEKKIEVYE